MFSLSIYGYVEEKTQSALQLGVAQQSTISTAGIRDNRKTCQTLVLLAGPSQLEHQSACPKLEIPLALSHQPSNSLPS